MAADRLMTLIDELAAAEVFDVTLAGGEPFLNPAIFEAIDRLVAHGVNLGVLSNGTLLDAKAAQRLTAAVRGRENFLLQISLDGVLAQTHDRTRGKGETVIANLDRLCRETDIRLQIATVLNAYNLDEIPKLIEKYYPRVKRYHFMNMQRTEWSLRHPDMFVGEEENKRFWENLEEHMKGLPSDILVTGLNLMRLMHRMEDDFEGNRQHSSFRCQSCTAGVTHVEITSNFDVIGCDIAKDYTVMGNVADTPFAEVWRSLRADWVRRYPFPACYLVKDPDGGCLAEGLAPDVAAYAERPPPVSPQAVPTDGQ